MKLLVYIIGGIVSAIIIIVMTILKAVNKRMVRV